MDTKEEYARLQEKVYELEGKIEHLRFSRRVLMNLLEKMVHERICTTQKPSRKQRNFYIKKK